MSEQKPSVGRIVLYRAAEEQATNGSVVHPAIITRVWSDDCVNLMTFPDCGTPTARSSVVRGSPDQAYSWSWPPRAG